VKVTNPVLVIGVLVAIWVLGWGDLSVANVLSGIAAAALVIAVFPIGRVPEGGGQGLRPLAAVHLLGYFVVELVRSNIAMTRDLLGGRGRIRTGIVAYPLRLESEGLATLLVNVLTLSPGCMPVELVDGGATDGRVLYLHLTRMYERDAVLGVVARYEVLIAQAFGAPHEREACSA
jgi:multicomponent Na+:H+ antiporter subunit E